jgi:hypothetical protein
VELQSLGASVVGVTISYLIPMGHFHHIICNCPMLNVRSETFPSCFITILLHFYCRFCKILSFKKKFFAHCAGYKPD